ncbi:hypothetical protein [Nocardiopsis oceani]
MNESEAIAVNQLMKWLALAPGHPGEEEARRAAAMLADNAHKTLGQGFTAARVLAVWPLCEEP